MAPTVASRRTSIGKLRGAETARIDDVRAVMLEATADISFLSNGPVQRQSLQGLRRLS
jgi:hypothetical protein